jgi:hypothetical protein
VPSSSPRRRRGGGRRKRLAQARALERRRLVAGFAALGATVAIATTVALRLGCSKGGAAAPSPARSSSSAALEAPAGPPPPLLPPSDRVFALPMADGGTLLLGADGSELWAVELRGRDARERWRVRGEGKGGVQLVAQGDFGRGQRIYAARGTRGVVRAPLVLEEIDPANGDASELWRHDGLRNDAVHLSVADVDADGEAELAFAYFVTNHEVRTRHLEADGTIVASGSMRMATTRAYADVDGDGTADEVIGRLYGDAGDAKGHIRARLGGAWVHVPTDRGVRSLVAVQPPRGAATLYFADGWSASYGRDARAQLKRARWNGERFQVDLLAQSEDEYTLFALAPFEVGGRAAVAAAGSHRVTLFAEPAERSTDAADWSTRALVDAAAVSTVAVAPAADACVWVLVPSSEATGAIQACLDEAG